MVDASCEGENMIDRFSNLPEPVAHHILSFLAITDLTRVGCVSKRCREFYQSTPMLNFDEFSLANTSSCLKRLKLLRSLDTFLIHRGDNKIHYFRLHWTSGQFFDHTPCFCEHNEKFRMITWIENAVRCKVETLDFDISILWKIPLAFPSCIFLCESVRFLTVDMSCKIEAPSFAFSSNLKCLDLTNVSVLDEGFFKWISLCCKCIEKLSLEHIYGAESVNIESSSLEIFSFVCVNQIDIRHLRISSDKLRAIVIDWRFTSPGNRSLTVFAPKLKYLFWIGNLMNHRSLGEFTCLEQVGIFLEPPEGDEPDNIFEDFCSRRLDFLILNEKAI